MEGANGGETWCAPNSLSWNIAVKSNACSRGTYFHTLVGSGRNIRIAFKRIDLVNCDAPMDGLVVPF